MFTSPLVRLRISVARIAQALGVDNNLEVLGKSYTELLVLACRNDGGWNDLASRCVDEVVQPLMKTIYDREEAKSVSGVK